MTRFPSKKTKLVLDWFLRHPDYKAYAAQIERDMQNKVSRVAISTICQDLYHRNVLAYDKIRPPRQKNTTEHYYLPRNKQALTNLLQAIVESGDDQWLWSFISTEYAQSCLTTSLVREVLAYKKVVFPRILPLGTWDEVERKKLISIMEKEHNHSLPSMLFHNMVWLHLPVFSESTPLEQRLEYIESLEDNEGIRRLDLSRNPSGIKCHYQVWEEEHVVLPILALIQISPRALVDFLLGSWQPCENKRCNSNITAVIDHVIFRLLMRAIDDVAVSRRIPHLSLVGDAFLCYQTFSDHKPTLFTLAMKDGRYVHFTATFNTRVNYYGDEDSSMSGFPFVNPESCWITAWMEGRQSGRLI